MNIADSIRDRLERLPGPRSLVEVGLGPDEVEALRKSAWTAGDRNVVVTARADRAVDILVSVTYGPAVHRLKVMLALKF